MMDCGQLLIQIQNILNCQKLKNKINSLIKIKASLNTHVHIVQKQTDHKIELKHEEM